MEYSMPEFEETWFENDIRSLDIWLGPDANYKDASGIDLYTACSIGDMLCVGVILEMYPKALTAVNKGQWTALMYAVYYCHEKVVEELLKRGASLHTRNKKGHNALMIAVKCGYDNLVAYLLKQNSILEARDEKDWTALFHAVHCGNIKVIQVLLSYKINPNPCEKYSGKTPLMYAAQLGDIQVVEILLRAGAFPGFVCPLDKEKTAATLAKEAGHIHIANLITEWRTKDPNLEEGPEAIGRMRDPLRLLCNSCEPVPATDVSNLDKFLNQLGLDLYKSLFREQQVDMHVFLSLTDKDLKECGVVKLGPRRKMTEAISRWHNNAPFTRGREGAYALKLEVELQELKELYSELDRKRKDNERYLDSLTNRLREINARCYIIRERMLSALQLASMVSFPLLMETLAFINARVEELLGITS